MSHCATSCQWSPPMSDRRRWDAQLRFYYSSWGAGGVGGQRTVSKRWKFSRRSFYRALCGRAEAVIAGCTPPSPPDGTPAAPRNPRVPLPPAACWRPRLRLTSRTPASGSAPCALCSAPVHKSDTCEDVSKHIVINNGKMWHLNNSEGTVWFTFHI